MVMDMRLAYFKVRCWTGALGRGDSADPPLLTGNPPKSIACEQICFSSSSLPATQVPCHFCILFHSHELYPALSLCFKVSVVPVLPSATGLGQSCMVGCKPSPPPSARQPHSWIPAAKLSGTTAAKTSQKTLPELPWHTMQAVMNILLLFQKKLLKEHTRQQCCGAVSVAQIKNTWSSF